MKIFIFGASGLLGRKLFTVLQKKHEVMGTCHLRTNPELLFFDIGNNVLTVVTALNKFDPDILLIVLQYQMLIIVNRTRKNQKRLIISLQQCLLITA